ncbi:MAG: hypothetical protein AAFO82_01275 [Bacteroidota bacterium]
MTYSIKVNEAKHNDFLELINALKKLGIVSSFSPVSILAREGNSISSDQLVAIIEQSREEVKMGKTLTLDQVKRKIASWKNK